MKAQMLRETQNGLMESKVDNEDNFNEEQIDIKALCISYEKFEHVDTLVELNRPLTKQEKQEIRQILKKEFTSHFEKPH